MSDSHSPLYETIYDPKRPARAPKSSEGGRHFICVPTNYCEGTPHRPADGIGDYQWRNIPDNLPFPSGCGIYTLLDYYTREADRAREAARAAQCSRAIQPALDSIKAQHARRQADDLRAISYARACGYPQNPS